MKTWATPRISLGASVCTCVVATVYQRVQFAIEYMPASFVVRITAQHSAHTSHFPDATIILVSGVEITAVRAYTR